MDGENNIYIDGSVQYCNNSNGVTVVLHLAIDI